MTIHPLHVAALIVESVHVAADQRSPIAGITHLARSVRAEAEIRRILSRPYAPNPDLPTLTKPW